MSTAAMYVSKQASAGADDLVTQHAPLVKRIAYHLISRLPPSVQPDDLIQVGMIGLLEAARNYNAGQGASFETYAGIRIRGAMLDIVHKNRKKYPFKKLTGPEFPLTEEGVTEALLSLERKESIRPIIVPD